MARVDLNGWVIYRGLALVGRREGAEETDPFNLIFFSIFIYIPGIRRKLALRILIINQVTTEKYVWRT